MKNYKEIELTVDSVAFGGKGVSRYNNYIVFITGGLPGDVVKVRFARRKKRYAEAYIVEILKPSPYRIDPICPYFGTCGGCKFQSLSYPQQLAIKQQQIIDSFERIGGMKTVEIQPILAAEETLYYRNKMEFAFSAHRWLLPQEIKTGLPARNRDFALGMHVADTFEKVLDLETCFLLSKESVDIVNWVRNYCIEHALAPYDIRKQQGYLRHLMIREGKKTNQRMINLLTTRYDEDMIKTFAEHLLAEFPETTTLVNNTTQSLSNITTGDQEFSLNGKQTIEEILGNFQFQISANSFFQTNTYQAQKLYDLIKKLAELTGKELVYDLYSGTGSIGIYLSDACRQVIGFELLESCVNDARQNAQINQVKNCDFVLMDLKHFRSFFSAQTVPDVLIIDPPRAGMHPDTVQAILDLRPKCIIHVSCNPTTLARDLSVLCQNNYQIDYIQAIDMFPHTAHIELVVRLKT